MTFLASTAAELENISILNAAIVAVLGYVVVFFGLILLMLVIMGMGKIFMARDTRVKAVIPTPASPAAVSVPEVSLPVAPGTAGELKLHDVSPKNAAMLMAIVANKLDKPLNELRFISIKEVK